MTLTRMQIARLNLAASFVVLGLKVSGYLVTKSTAIFSDALETLINILTALTAILVIRFVSKPADENHPYGHGKVEFFSAAFEGGLVFFASITILIESLRSFQNVNYLQDVPQGLIFLILASIINLSMALALRRVGDRENSETLKASSLHLMSDVYTTAGVIVGLGFVMWTGLGWVDSVISALVALHLVVESYRILRRSVSGLTDEMDQASLKQLADAINRNLKPGIINIHNLRAIRAGSFHHIDAHLIVPEFWDVAKVHRVTHDFEAQVVSAYKYDGEFAFHLDPCGRNYCSHCDVPECPIRGLPFEKRFVFTSENMIKGVAAVHQEMAQSH